MNISHASRESGLPARTIRYYEGIGLLSPGRDDNGYRDFSASDVHRLQFLARARTLGFAIEDCRALLGLWQDRSRASADVKRIAAEHVATIETKIEELSQMRDTLNHLMEHCHGDVRPDCPILDRLADSD